MDAFLSRKRPRSPQFTPSSVVLRTAVEEATDHGPEDDSTDFKLAILSSLHSDVSQEALLEILLDHDGSVERSSNAISSVSTDLPPPKRKVSAVGAQTALSFGQNLSVVPSLQSLTKRGRTLHLYRPEDIAIHTPCSIIHNFLPSDLANELLEELLPEVPSYTSATFKLFDNVVKSPHTASFYVDSSMLAEQRHTYLYNGSYLSDVRQLLPTMSKVSHRVQEAVNDEVKTRIRTHYPNGEKLKFQSSKEWQPNAAFVNCYDGPAQSVGYHSDQLSYLGPRAVIGSLSLGVAREFRVRKIVPPDSPPQSPGQSDKASRSQADQQGQIAIHLPHNSLLVMHAEMQEEWKHSIAPAQSIDPHPIAGNKRINITYRWYREEFHPSKTPRCKCGTPTVLKCVQKRKETRGRYMWMCQVGSRAEAKAAVDVDSTEGAVGCGYFQWAEFTDDGQPVWKEPAGNSTTEDVRTKHERFLYP
ncbi:uncharacterized protein AB675_1548 [Cyphellophora attinorum]|uniref:Uncharacterized protein n=1 Tax=Cyphellophora attinorum TaxID=1664694 RepID=A0A0N0NJS0_9EURO|nr:uncharacterized protein AB675_1548 [Phialophora attinorum]KPI37301.1 hypothetical protein AB675_1548 [Phialophora attinorum]